MSLEHLDVVHVGLPVLHVAAVIRCQHPHVVVRPGHGPDWTVMGLQRGQARPGGGVLVFICVLKLLLDLSGSS